MTNHPNRAKPVQPGTPTPEEIKAARTAAGLTQEAAAALIWYAEVAWKQWEGGTRRMHPCTWWAFQQRASVLAPPPRRSPASRGPMVIAAEVRDTRCPLCGAASGQDCDSTKGQTWEHFHPERVDAARAAKALASE